MSDKKPLFVNVFGERFIEVDGKVEKISPETGDSEMVCSAADFNPSELDDYWTGSSIKEVWELGNGPLPIGHLLIPITPFCLGGEFEISNLMAIPEQEAYALYEQIMATTNGAPDGTKIEMKVVK